MSDLELDLERARKSLDTFKHNAERSHQNCIKKKDNLLQLLKLQEETIIQLRKYKLNSNGNLVAIDNEKKLQKSIDASLQKLKAAIETMVEDIIH